MAGYVSAPPGAYQYAHLTASALVKTGRGSLQTLVIGTGAADATVTLYDGTTGAGTVIGIVDTANTTGLWFGVQFNTGLYIEISGVVDITVTYS